MAEELSRDPQGTLLNDVVVNQVLPAVLSVPSNVVGTIGSTVPITVPRHPAVPLIFSGHAGFCSVRVCLENRCAVTPYRGFESLSLLVGPTWSRGEGVHETEGNSTEARDEQHDTFDVL